MSKCTRNILLIFGLLLIVNSLFFPCDRIHYGFHYGLQETENAKVSDFIKYLRERERKERLKEKQKYTLEELLEMGELEKTRLVSSEYEYLKVFFPLIISRANKYEAYVKWESSVFLLILEKKNEAITEKEINEIYQKKIKEFHDKFGYDPYYHQIRVGGFFIELGLLILMGGLAYIFFGIVLRKIREVDRMKKRKIGIILSLIGIGIPLVFSPFYYEKAPFNAIGIILFLIGIGMVIFSFLPKEKETKK